MKIEKKEKEVKKTKEKKQKTIKKTNKIEKKTKKSKKIQKETKTETEPVHNFILVSNFPYSCETSELEDLFKVIGPIKSIEKPVSKIIHQIFFF